jgi:F-type H+-transporting ATPase subunit a
VVPLPSVFGIDFSITNEVLLLWTAAALTFVMLVAACRRRGPVAKGLFQNFFDAIVEFLENEVIRGGIGRDGMVWAPFLLTLFFFILFSNLMGMVPVPSVFKSVTSDLSVTLALAVVVFAVTAAIGVRRHGMLGFFRRFFPSGLPRWIAPIVVPIEVVSWLVKPASLAIRLFANMMVGHYLIFIFIGLEMAAAWYLKSLPLIGAVAMGCFEIFVSFIQAFIFTMLAGIYIREAITAH